MAFVFIFQMCYCCYKIIVYHWIVKCEWPHSVDVQWVSQCIISSSQATHTTSCREYDRKRYIHIDRESMSNDKAHPFVWPFSEGILSDIYYVMINGIILFVCLFVIWILWMRYFSSSGHIHMPPFRIVEHFHNHKK